MIRGELDGRFGMLSWEPNDPRNRATVLQGLGGPYDDSTYPLPRKRHLPWPFDSSFPYRFPRQFWFERSDLCTLAKSVLALLSSSSPLIGQSFRPPCPHGLSTTTLLAGVGRLMPPGQGNPLASLRFLASRGRNRLRGERGRAEASDPLRLTSLARSVPPRRPPRSWCLAPLLQLSFHQPYHDNLISKETIHRIVYQFYGPKHDMNHIIEGERLFLYS